MPKKKRIKVRVSTVDGEHEITYQGLRLLQRLESQRTIVLASDRSGEHSTLRGLKKKTKAWGLELTVHSKTWTCQPFALETYEPGALEAEADRKASIEKELSRERYERP